MAGTRALSPLGPPLLIGRSYVPPMIRCFNEFTRDSIVNDILSAISFELGYLATVSEQFSSPSPSFIFYLSFFSLSIARSIARIFY